MRRWRATSSFLSPKTAAAAVFESKSVVPPKEHAATAGARIQRSLDASDPQAGHHPLHERQVHHAHHLSLQGVVRLQQDWDADGAALDIFTEILTMADALSDGIVAQFPGALRR